MTRPRIAFGFVVAYFWVMVILLGSITLETFMVYPNIFHDPPRSLEAARDFLSVSAPNDFFPPMGFLSWVTGVGALVLSWPVKPARSWIVLSLAMVLCEGLFSMAFFWPRNEIMFVEGTAVHSAAFLEQTATAFTRLHWARLGFNAVGSVAIFVGLLRFHRWIAQR